MPHGKKKPAHYRAPPPPPTHKFCTYCQVHQLVRTFAKHQKACKRIWQVDHEARGVNRTMPVGNDLNDKDSDEMVITSVSGYYYLLHIYFFYVDGFRPPRAAIVGH